MNQIRVIGDATAASLPTPVTKATSRTGQHEATLVLWADDLEEIGARSGAGFTGKRSRVDREGAREGLREDQETQHLSVEPFTRVIWK